MALKASMVDSAANGKVGLSLEIAFSLGPSLNDEYLCPTQALSKL